jgi:TatD DNase family protein
MKYVDVHCHLNFPEYALDLEETLKRAREKEVGMIVVGVDFETSKEAIKLAEENENIWAIVGLHPANVHCEIFGYERYISLAENPKVVGIGECGFDFYRQGQAPFEVQKEVFIKHIEIANELKKPLMLHLRNGMQKDENAYDKALEILKGHAKVPGDAHFFAGTMEQGKKFLDLGFRLSFTGVITFVRDYDEIIKNIPLNMIMAETDSPYVTPVPYRGTRNEPAYITEVAQAIGAVRGEPQEKILPHLVDNAKELFSI